MADNFLEDQYEKYQARKAAWEKAGKPKMDKSHTLEKSYSSKAPDTVQEDEPDESDKEER